MLLDEPWPDMKTTTGVTRPPTAARDPRANQPPTVTLASSVASTQAVHPADRDRVTVFSPAAAHPAVEEIPSTMGIRRPTDAAIESYLSTAH